MLELIYRMTTAEFWQEKLFHVIAGTVFLAVGGLVVLFQKLRQAKPSAASATPCAAEADPTRLGT